MKPVTEKELYDLVHSIGEVISGDMHIIDTSDQYKEHEDCGQYRMYHKKGYCIDVEKYVRLEREDGEVVFDYSFYDEWEGFLKVNIQTYYNIIKANAK